MPQFRIILKDAGEHLITADGWKEGKLVNEDVVLFVAEGEAGRTAADQVEQSKRIAAVVKFSELAAILKVGD